MIDPSSFSTALWTVLIASAIILAFGLAALSDMAMRRREDRADERRRDSARERNAAHRRGSASGQDPDHQRGPARWQNSVASANGHHGGASSA